MFFATIVISVIAFMGMFAVLFQKNNTLTSADESNATQFMITGSVNSECDVHSISTVNGVKHLAFIAPKTETTLIADYTVQVNNIGIQSLLLKLNYPKDEGFAVNTIKVNNQTILGEATLSEKLFNDSTGYYVLLENAELYSTSGDVLVTVEYVVSADAQHKIPMSQMQTLTEGTLHFDVNLEDEHNGYYQLGFEAEAYKFADDATLVKQTEVNVVVEPLFVHVADENELFAASKHITIESLDEPIGAEWLKYGETITKINDGHPNAWYKANSWYIDPEMTNSIETMPAYSLDVFGEYYFAVGLGDVNGDFKVDTDDIDVYRKNLVGGYNITIVEAGAENATPIDPTKIYFLKRVADVNYDGVLDIRDISNIRMAINGGFYGYSVFSQADMPERITVDINTFNNLYAYFITKQDTILMSADVTSDLGIALTTDQFADNVTLDLGGHTLTVGAFKLLSECTDANITIQNGTIVTKNGFDVQATNGTVNLVDVIIQDENGNIILNATTSSLHFAGDVSFYNANGETAMVQIPADTHVVIEAGATLTAAGIDIIPVESTQAEPVTFTIDVLGQTSNTISEVESDFVITSTTATTENTPAIEISGDCSQIVADDTVECDYKITSAEALFGAIANTECGGTITFDADIVITEFAQISDSITIDLNGHTLSSTTYGFVIMTGTTDKQVVIKNGTVRALAEGYAPIYCADSDVTISNVQAIGDGHAAITAYDNATVTLLDGTVAKSTYGALVWGDASKHYSPVLNVYDATLIGTDFAISGNGTDYDKDDLSYNSTTVNIYEGAVLTSDATGIYNPQNGTVNVYGGTIYGKETGIEIRAGNLNVAGGEISSTVFPTEVNANSDGTTTAGAGIAVVQHTTKLPINVNINGGIISAYTPLIESNPHHNSDSDMNKIFVTITGGEFNVINGGTTAIVIEDAINLSISDEYVAQSNYTAVNSAEALATAIADASITYIALTADIDLATELQVTDGMKKIVCLNNHNINLIEGENNKVNSAFQIKNGSLVLTGEGRIEGAPSNYKAIYLYGDTNPTAQNYSVLTINEKVLVDCTNGYAVMISANGNAGFGVVITTSGVLAGAYGGLYINGTITQTDGNVPVFNVSGGIIATEGTAIYAAGFAIWNIDNAVLTGAETGMEIRAGIVSVKNSTIIGNGTPTNVNANGNGTTTVGAGIAVAQHTTKLPIRVIIADSIVKGFTALYESNPQHNSDEDLAKIYITVEAGNEFLVISGGTNQISIEDAEKIHYINNND